MSIDWAAERKQFPILRDRAYFASPSIGVHTHAAEEEVFRYVASWCDRPKAAYKWVDDFFAAHGTVERFINAEKSSVFLTTSVTAAQQAIASCLHSSLFDPAQDMVMVDPNNFASARHVWAGMKPRGFHAYEFADLSELADHRGEVAMVVLPLVSPVDGRLNELEIQQTVAWAKHQPTPALVLVDAFHALGIVPVDVQKLGADIVVGGMSKWVGAPSFGCCFGYVSPRALERLHPSSPGWMGHADPFGFEGTWRPAPGAGKFRQGAPVVEPIYGAMAQLKWIERVGMQNIRLRSLELTNHLTLAAVEEGLEVISPEWPDDRGGMVVIRVPNGVSPFAVVEACAKEGIDVDGGIRPDTLRMGPHPTMTEAECDRAIRAILTAVAS